MNSIEKILTQDLFRRLVDGSVDKVAFNQSDGGCWVLQDPPTDIALFPGSFNPLHVGHQEMARLAAQRLGRPVWFEISIGNVEKANLKFADVVERLKQIEHKAFSSAVAIDQGPSGIVLTTATTFVEKLHLFPHSVYIVGADTIIRINELRFYRDADHRYEVFQQFANDPEGNRRSSRFLVFGRWREEVFELDQVELEPNLRAQCEFVSQTEFEQRVSSTELRD